MRSLMTYGNSAKLLFVLLGVFFSSCEKIKDDLSDCGMYLEFIYDHNMEYADSFDPQVPCVDVFFFDTDGRYLFTRHSVREALDGRKRMYIGNDVPPGRYQILTVGGLSGSFRITDRDGSPLSPGQTLLRDVETALVRDIATVSGEFPDLWVGEPVAVDHRNDMSVWPIRLMKYTNRFYVRFAPAKDETRTARAAEPAYTFEILTPEGAVYATDHSPRSEETVTYTPYLFRPDDSGSLSAAEINTVRILHRGGYNFTVRNSVTDRVLWEYDLIDLLAYTKPARRPDGNSLSVQEYLDRQSSWHIIVLYDDPSPGGSGEYLAVGIKINGWVIWFNEIGW